ncbi:YhcH/YjgK/YiaL family protein [Propionivibrio sp.]|uniref:YhcH/YjgK/YiaL family protein n=1 Tax=Propionivibrio sp. TaxID=2212460 RepID=UPI0039E548D8
MIVGRISDIATQRGALPGAIVRALEALQKVDLGALEPGRYEIEGDKLFYLVQDVELRTMEESRAEAHQKYADIQIPFSTAERYGFALPQPELAPSDDQLEAKDLAFYPTPAGECFVDAAPGTYLVFLPTELHRPCLAIKDKATIRKAVVKVHASLLGM